MKSFITGFFILILWFCVGSWAYTCKIKAFCVVQQPPESSMPVQEKAVVKDTLEAAETTNEPAKETTDYNKILYFKFDSEEHKKDEAFRQYISDVKAYLAKNPGKKLSIIGHTDSKGETTDNEWLGMQRAKNAREYLVSQGIPEEKILVFSKGETTPIASNTTTAGRKQNRRVEIIVN